jgi:hypothetical protein
MLIKGMHSAAIAHSQAEQLPFCAVQGVLCCCVAAAAYCCLGQHLLYLFQHTRQVAASIWPFQQRAQLLGRSLLGCLHAPLVRLWPWQVWHGALGQPGTSQQPVALCRVCLLIRHSWQLVGQRCLQLALALQLLQALPGLGTRLLKVLHAVSVIRQRSGMPSCALQHLHAASGCAQGGGGWLQAVQLALQQPQPEVRHSLLVQQGRLHAGGGSAGVQLQHSLWEHDRGRAMEVSAC